MRRYAPEASGRQLLTPGRPPKTRSGSGNGTRVLIVSVLANSWSRSSSGRPIVRRVVFRIATRSQRRSASSRRWVVRKIVTPRRRSSLISPWTSRVATGSRPAVGSSRNSTSGSLSSALARSTRWRSPLDSAPQASPARSARHYWVQPTGLGNVAPLDLAHVDWRGRGGYVVAPPSRHASGGTYRFVRGREHPIPPVPEVLRARLDPPVRQTPTPAALQLPTVGHPYVTTALARECEQLAATPPIPSGATAPRTPLGCGCTPWPPAARSTLARSTPACSPRPVPAGWVS